MKKVVLVVMDGIGVSNKKEGNAFLNANTPNLDYLMNNYPNTIIHAHGKYVGLPSDEDMGNSEVGHNALGCGQIYSQGAKLVDESIKNKSLFEGETWKKLVLNAKNHVMHFIGLLSDGNVHSNIYHLFSLIEEAKASGVHEVRIHVLLDGRDVEEKSSPKYIKMLEDKLNELNDENFNACIASGGGRMRITMDRYEANWDMVNEGYKTHVLGIARGFSSALDAIKTYQQEEDATDQHMPSFVIVKNNEPIGKMHDGDSVIFFNFRGDRALEISRMFDDDNFDKFDVSLKPKVMYAGMLQYDADLKIPKNYLLPSPKILNTLTEQLSKYNITEYAISETQKYGHVTYFWNGNKIEKIDEKLETYDEIASDNISFDQKPEMKAKIITDKTIDAILSNKYQFIRLNYPNGDMVGHTGNYEATIKAVETVDESIGRLMDVVKNEDDTILMILADHGNAEEMLGKDNVTPKTSHTTNPVPFIIYGKNVSNIKIKDGDFGLANVASTVTDLFNVPKHDSWLESIIK